MLLRNYVTTVSLYLINNNIDVSCEKSFSRLLNIDVEAVHWLIKFVLWFSRLEYFVKLLAEVLLVSKIVLNCALQLQGQIKTVVTFVEFVAQLDFGTAGRPDPVFVVRKWVHTANFLKLFPELVLADLTLKLSGCLLINFTQNFVQSLFAYP